MNERDALNDVAATIDDVAIRLAALSERLYARVDDLQDGPEEAMEPMDQTRWMRGARKELSLLLREIEGPNPPPAPRRAAP